ncbi:unnamed protein product [Trichobilharzia regenti]|nr:unnamed protein product [Trichobilharzia regenti]
MPNKFDTSTQTDDFYSKSWTTGSLDSPNNQVILIASEY